jgi:hypothetical protein
MTPRTKAEPKPVRKRKGEVTTGFTATFLTAENKKAWQEANVEFDVLGADVNTSGGFGERVVYSVVDGAGQSWLMSFGLTNPDGSPIEGRRREVAEFIAFFDENPGGAVGPCVLAKRGRAWVIVDSEPTVDDGGAKS